MRVATVERSTWMWVGVRSVLELLPYFPGLSANSAGNRETLGWTSLQTPNINSVHLVGLARLSGSLLDIIIATICY